MRKEIGSSSVSSLSFQKSRQKDFRSSIFWGSRSFPNKGWIAHHAKRIVNTCRIFTLVQKEEESLHTAACHHLLQFLSHTGSSRYAIPSIQGKSFPRIFASLFYHQLRSPPFSLVLSLIFPSYTISIYLPAILLHGNEEMTVCEKPIKVKALKNRR